MDNMTYQEQLAYKRREINLVLQKLKDTQSLDHLCFDGIWEYFIKNDSVYRSHRGNLLDLDSAQRTNDEHIHYLNYFIYTYKNDRQKFQTFYSYYPTRMLDSLVQLIAV